MCTYAERSTNVAWPEAGEMVPFGVNALSEPKASLESEFLC